MKQTNVDLINIIRNNDNPADALVNKDIAELLSLLLDGNPDDNLKILLSIDFSQA